HVRRARLKRACNVMNYNRYAATRTAACLRQRKLRCSSLRLWCRLGRIEKFQRPPAQLKNIVYDSASFVGLVAQLVEQRIENPRVGGSIPPQATTEFKAPDSIGSGAFFLCAQHGHTPMAQVPRYVDHSASRA